MVEDYPEAQEFHENTKHSYISVRTSTYTLDWSNKPHPFKEYLDVEYMRLPRDIPKPEEDSLKCVFNIGRVGESRVDLRSLASILYFTGGITRVVRYFGETFYFRAAPATGALYPIELYVLAGDVDGLDPGLYHFNPLMFSLAVLRKGDFRGFLSKYSDEGITGSQACIIFTSIGWRNAWKYRERSYRHWFWDSGVMVANLLATCSAFGVGVNVVTFFVDEMVNRLVDVDGVGEASIILAPIGRSDVRPPEIADVQRIGLRVRPLSRREIRFEMVEKMHRASAISSTEELSFWRGRAVKHSEEDSEKVGGLMLEPIENGPPLWEVVLRRGSTRRFSRKPITFQQFSTIVKAASTRFPADFIQSSKLYLICNAVEGLDSGAYVLEDSGLRLLKAGEFRKVSGYLTLEQRLGADAAAVLFFMAPMEGLLKRLGNRGYRVMQLEGGVRAGFSYLAAYSVGIGATGLTFYDDDVKTFFSPHAADKENVIVVAVGHPSYKAKPGKIFLGLD